MKLLFFLPLESQKYEVSHEFGTTLARWKNNAIKETQKLINVPLILKEMKHGGIFLTLMTAEQI